MELSISASVSTVSTVSSDGSKSQSSLTVYGESDESQDLYCEVIGVLVCLIVSYHVTVDSVYMCVAICSCLGCCPGYFRALFVLPQCIENTIDSIIGNDPISEATMYKANKASS